VLLSLQILNLYLKSREKKEEEKRLIFFNSSATLCMRYFFFLTKNLSISLIKYHVHSEEIKIVNMIGKHLQTKEKNQNFFLLVLCFLFFAVCLVCDVCC
jgi:hypothetical protein